MTESGDSMDAGSPQDSRLRRFYLLGGLAVAFTLIVTVVGLVFWLVDPQRATVPYDVLGVVAAITGLATGLLFVVAAIYGAVSGAWRLVPTRVRITAYLLLAAAAMTAIALGSQT